MASKTTTPKRNIHWLEVRKAKAAGQDVEVEERKTVFVYCRGLHPEAVINWSSFDATEAQRWLKSVSFARCCRPQCGVRVGRLGDSCGNHEEDKPVPKKQTKTPRYTVEPGRQIYRDGQPFISVGRETSEGYPADTDEVTHIICALLNRCGKREVLTNYLNEPTKLRLK